MSKELAQELQEHLAKKAVALLVTHGSMADTETFEQSVAILGTAWELPEAETQRLLELIRKEKELVTTADAAARAVRALTPDDPAHILPLSELPVRSTGNETLDNIWMLFETATMLPDEAQRVTLYNMAHDLEEYENLLDWIEQTPEEKLAWMPPLEQTQGEAV